MITFKIVNEKNFLKNIFHSHQPIIIFIQCWPHIMFQRVDKSSGKRFRKL